MIQRVPFTADEKESLRASLDRHRDLVLWKLEGLSEEQLRAPMTASGTNLAGLVKHLAAVSYGWFCDTFGRQHEPMPFDENDPEADMRLAPDETVESVVAFYQRARTASDAVLDELSLDATGTAWYGPTVTLRWVVIHMLEEFARHAGHMDIVREAIDGSTGDWPPDDISRWRAEALLAERDGTP